MIDASVEELRTLSKIQSEVTAKFMGRPAHDVLVWSQLRDELTTRMREAGFECVVNLEERSGNWYPVVEITSRVDKKAQAIIDEEGLDIERHRYEAQHTTSEKLKQEGIDTDLLMG
jgi:hypothetical protein